MSDQTQKISLDIDYIKHINYASVHNHIVICHKFEITNLTQEDIRNVCVSVEGQYIKDYHSPVLAVLPAGERVSLKSVEISPKPDELLNFTERVVSSFTVKINDTDSLIFSNDYDVELMAYDQWLGISVLPQMIASFVMPNQPVVTSIIPKAAAKLKEKTGQSAFSAYQTGDINEVINQIAAIYAAIHEEGIVYRSLPAAFEEIGQRVTLPDQVLLGKVGNCIELTILFASILESVGINSGLVIHNGHAYIGVWLVDDCCKTSICDDPSYIEKKCSKGINEILLFECTSVTNEVANFENAMQQARTELASSNDFIMFIDIRRCRLENFLPLPTRTLQDGRWLIDVVSVEHNLCNFDVQYHSRYDLSNLFDKSRELNKYDIWERKLLDFSLRNALLNISLRRKAIQFISFNVGAIEDFLQDGEEYCILPKPDIEFNLNSEDRLIRSQTFPMLNELIVNDIEHKQLHTYQTEAETQSILKNIYRGARNAVEETGANSLFLAIGTLRWYERPISQQAHYAPILLLPVDIVYKKGHYFIRMRDEEISLNITLVEFLRQNYNIKINGIETLPKDEHGVDVPKIFAYFRDCLKEQQRWDVEEECILGTFSFSKFLMWNDVHNNRQLLEQNKIVESLVKNHLTWQPEELVSSLRETDKMIRPADLSLPVSVDSSQMAAVIEGGLGHSFILYGPPGTGKSQTITNLISNALFQGKRVLFVAEKMAALSVVQSRLAKIGLAPFCLELHSNKVAKRHILDQLDQALKVAHIQSPEAYQQTAEELYKQRSILLDYIESLHAIDPSDGFSIHDVMIRYESIDAPLLDNFTLTDAINQQLTASSLAQYEDILGGQLRTLAQLVGGISRHPFCFLPISQKAMTDAQSFVNIVRANQINVQKINELYKFICTILNCQIPDKQNTIFAGYNLLNRLKDDYVDARVAQVIFDDTTIVNISNASLRIAERNKVRDEILRANKEEIFGEDPISLAMQWQEIQAKWFLSRHFASKKFIARMRFYNPSITPENINSLLQLLLDYKKKNESYQSDCYNICQVLGRNFTQTDIERIAVSMPCLRQSVDEFVKVSGLSTSTLRASLCSAPFDNIRMKMSDFAEIDSMWANIVSQLYEYADMASYAEHVPNFSQSIVVLFENLQTQSDKLRDWYQWSIYRQQMINMALYSVVETVENEDVDVDALRNRFFKSFFKKKCEIKLSAKQSLLTFEGLLFDQQIEKYRAIAQEFQILSQKELYARLASRIPRVTDNVDGSSEIGLLNRNISNGGRGMSLRDLLDQIPTLLPRLCPCMLMSPMSVAQYLNLAQDKFDLVVFDEASQMPTSEAVGAIARGKSLIVVGDPKQMPPTSFFSSTNVDEEEADIDDMESILEDCRTLGIPSLQLNWHYRSRHESLIAFSNHEYYDGELITFPSTDDRQTRVKFVHVDGFYDKGAKRSNKAEADAIVAEIKRRLVDESLVNQSVGVVAFSVAQQNLIEDVLQKEIDNDKLLQERAESMYEPIFVKNLENVQGDERDVILFSIGYGPDKTGKVSMNFGPLNNSGGERRLNVAVSRARSEMIIYSTLKAADIDLRRSKARGVEGLRHFLEYAENEHLVKSASDVQQNCDKAIATQIAKALEDRGLKTQISVGRSQFKVDIAVVDPQNSDRYILGLMLDGDGYYNTQTTRDRDIVQPSVLENLEWRVMRVWCVDWFNNPERVVNRIVDICNTKSEIKVKEHSNIQTFDISNEKEIEVSTKAIEYIKGDIDKIAKTKIPLMVATVISTEQPLTFEWLCKRIAERLEQTRVTQSLRDTIGGFLHQYIVETQPNGVAVIWYDTNKRSTFDAYRPNTKDIKRDISDIPFVEINNVILETVAEQFSISQDGMTLLAAKKLGFARRGANVDAAFKAAVDSLKEKGLLNESDGKLHK